jgi:hypothetical protein
MVTIFGLLQEETHVIIENHGFENVKTDLAQFDNAGESFGFIRWQWEYYRATYDLLIEDPEKKADYFLRIGARAVKGKLEDPETELIVTDVYIGRATFPHGLDYQSAVPDQILNVAKLKLADLKKKLS